jgi:hypothetical protein
MTKNPYQSPARTDLDTLTDRARKLSAKSMHGQFPWWLCGLISFFLGLAGLSFCLVNVQMVNRVLESWQIVSSGPSFAAITFGSVVLIIAGLVMLFRPRRPMRYGDHRMSDRVETPSHDHDSR